jgi:hypothetical protein
VDATGGEAREKNRGSLRHCDQERTHRRLAGGPIVPFATSSTPAVMTGPMPATSFRALADTVPMP